MAQDMQGEVFSWESMAISLPKGICVISIQDTVIQGQVNDLVVNMVPKFGNVGFCSALRRFSAWQDDAKMLQAGCMHIPNLSDV